MISDQIFNSGTGERIDVPEFFRESHRKLVIFLLARNYRVPDELMKKAEQSQV